MLIALACMAYSSGEAWPKQETLARDCGLHRDTARHALKDAERLGFIRTIRRQRGLLYVLPWSRRFDGAEVLSDRVTPPGLQASRSGQGIRSRSDRKARSDRQPLLLNRKTESTSSSTSAPRPQRCATRPVAAAHPPIQDSDIDRAQQALSRHSETGVDRQHAERAIRAAAGNIEAIEHWARQRRSARLGHAGAVLCVFLRDLTGILAAMQALQEAKRAAVEQERREADAVGETPELISLHAATRPDGTVDTAVLARLLDETRDGRNRNHLSEKEINVEQTSLHPEVKTPESEHDAPMHPIVRLLQERERTGISERCWARVSRLPNGPRGDGAPGVDG